MPDRPDQPIATPRPDRAHPDQLPADANRPGQQPDRPDAGHPARPNQPSQLPADKPEPTPRR